jgi:hypothetical protein
MWVLLKKNSLWTAYGENEMIPIPYSRRQFSCSLPAHANDLARAVSNSASPNHADCSIHAYNRLDNRPDLDDAVAKVRHAFAEHQLRDGLVAIERTGRYHRLVQRTFAAAGFETRILHPFVTKQYRQPVDP